MEGKKRRIQWEGASYDVSPEALARYRHALEQWRDGIDIDKVEGGPILLNIARTYFSGPGREERDLIMSGEQWERLGGFFTGQDRRKSK